MNISYLPMKDIHTERLEIEEKKKDKMVLMSSGIWHTSEPEILHRNRQSSRVWPAYCHWLWTSHGIKIRKNLIRKGIFTESVDQSSVVGSIVKWESAGCMVKENTNTMGWDHQRQGQDVGLACESMLLKSIVHRVAPQPYNPEAIFRLVMWIITTSQRKQRVSLSVWTK